MTACLGVILDQLLLMYQDKRYTAGQDLPECHGNNGPLGINCIAPTCTGTNCQKDGPTDIPCQQDEPATVTPAYTWAIQAWPVSV
jgi:hypothetical protein